MIFESYTDKTVTVTLHQEMRYMRDIVFIDTNILLYALTEPKRERQREKFTKNS